MNIALSALLTIAAGALSAALIGALFPLMRKYALARPNARSSHVEPTPQGGGAAVVAATLLVVGVAWTSGLITAPDALVFPVLAGAAVLLAVLGAFDDIRPLSVGLRLGAQVLAVAATVVAAAQGGAIWGDAMPLWLELALATFAGLWFVNLTNFMDGLDWITVAIMLPITATIGLLGTMGVVDPLATAVALALCGALAGFAPFNRPVARLFLGDVGSLPIGLLVAFLLYALAGAGHLVAALILALYPCSDATITLLRRLARGEQVWMAHRTHFYQRATDNGFTPLAVSLRVFVLQCALAAIAVVSVLHPAPMVAGLAFAAAAALVALCLARFSRGLPQAGHA